MAEPGGERPPSTTACAAMAENGVVLLDGPHGAIVTLTPEAAALSGENLRRAACLAARQRADAAGGAVVPLRPRESEEG